MPSPPQDDVTTTEDRTVDLAKDSVKGLVPCSSVPPSESDCTEPMETDSDTTKAKFSEASTAKIKDEKSSAKSAPSDSAPPCPSSSSDPKQEKEIKTVDIKVEKPDKRKVKKSSTEEEKMDMDSVKVEPKKEKIEVGKTTKPSRPSSTPPSNTGKKCWR